MTMRDGRFRHGRSVDAMLTLPLRSGSFGVWGGRPSHIRSADIPLPYIITLSSRRASGSAPPPCPSTPDRFQARRTQGGGPRVIAILIHRPPPIPRLSHRHRLTVRWPIMVKADGLCDPTVRLPPGWEGVAVRHCFAYYHSLPSTTRMVIRCARHPRMARSNIR